MVLALACGRSRNGPSTPGPVALGDHHVTESHVTLAPVATSDRARVRYHMRDYVDDLREVERFLIAGKLADATSRAYMLSRPVRDPSLAPWSEEIAGVSQRALALTQATSIEQGCRLAPQIAVACASCHQRAGAQVLGRAEPPPPQGPSASARLARHAWAADRLWTGLIAPSDQAWREGLHELEATPMLVPVEAAGRRLQVLAREALATSKPDRARIYGDLLVTCARCHQQLGLR